MSSEKSRLKKTFIGKKLLRQGEGAKVCDGSTKAFKIKSVKNCPKLHYVIYGQIRV